MALEANYRVYQDTISAGLQLLRPRAEIKSVGLEALDEEIERFQPQVIISSEKKTVGSGSSLAWIELSLDPTSPTNICLRGHCFARTNPTLEELLEVIDKIE